ncbi:hypothetical protein ACOME3_007564 [Neoechinorhynchus agilis]
METDPEKQKNYLQKDGPIQKVKHILECRICSGFLRKPVRNVECLHAFCAECAKERMDQLSKYSCPNCISLAKSEDILRNMCPDESLDRIVRAFTESPITQEDFLCIKLTLLNNNLQCPTVQPFPTKSYFQVSPQMPVRPLMKLLRQRMQLDSEETIEFRTVIGLVKIDEETRISELVKNCQDTTLPNRLLNIFVNLGPLKSNHHKGSIASSPKNPSTSCAIPPCLAKKSIMLSNRTIDGNPRKNSRRNGPSWERVYEVHGIAKRQHGKASVAEVKPTFSNNDGKKSVPWTYNVPGRNFQRGTSLPSRNQFKSSYKSREGISYPATLSQSLLQKPPPNSKYVWILPKGVTLHESSQAVKQRKVQSELLTISDVRTMKSTHTSRPSLRRLSIECNVASVINDLLEKVDGFF